MNTFILVGILESISERRILVFIRYIYIVLMLIRDHILFYHQREHCEAARIEYGGILVRITFFYFFVLN
jgi:hypothetical protein